MDFGSIAEFLRNKTIFVTGATGFIAKILLEKILRVQPNVKRLYLLVRATDANSADSRLRDEVLGKELFKVLREKWGSDFDSFVSEKIIAVAGDASYENLGLAADQIEEMYENIDIVINVAAATKFKERYDVALGVNTLGAKNVVNFAKNCANIELLIHVSTAYVCGEKAGLISENLYAMGETLSGEAALDIDSEKKLIEETIRNLVARKVPEQAIRERMKILGSQRAKLYGWPNTYVFTKAMGEMVIRKLRGNLPVVVMRPTIVCSTLKEPFSGWLEGCRTIDTVTVMYGKGTLSVLSADISSVFDLIPADMFVNSIIVAMKANVNKPCLTIYQVGSSYRNPVSFEVLHGFYLSYFSKNPWSNRDGNPIKIRKCFVLSNILIFEIILILFHFMVQMILNFVTKMGCSNLHQMMLNFEKKLTITTTLVDLYKPYLFFKGIFLDTNTNKLLKTARQNGLDEDMFNFDPECINWQDYIMNVHIPATVRYLF
ncbi:fatty acyl-CoA reductase 3 [Beta vulgaris subsp. vulgaris]|uniref:fatty acyl-CoA reductase 3 n=1 Tax=Beta vulgaris subsp. vulgaris TaxID=3555 RepID=UPI002036941C|nr:fatty acyl-CoA reductase 3 [Beta vulgaris subsp. vulgaris]